MPEHPRIAYVVSHTHWDREWYLTFPRFRVMLHAAVQGVLDRLEQDEAYRHFCLDGQAIVLEDHLEIHPEDETRVRRLAEAGALSLGPWYVLPDEFLIPPETAVRNLVVGHRVASRYGPVAKIGYVPDAFGHVAQLPQLLREAGIDAFVYTRGDGDALEATGLEWIWEAPDGSEVLAVHQLGGYCNAAALGYEELWHAHTRREIEPARAVAKVEELFTRMGERSNGDVWLLNNGCDHHPVQPALGEILAALEKAFPETEFRHASHAAFLEAVREANVAVSRFRGELAGGRYHHILSGVWSARMPLKQANETCETLLTSVLEPLASATHFLNGRAYPKGAIDHAWKRLLENQPHDSICGCSTDEVHRDMEPRFREVRDTAESLIEHELQALLPTFGRRPEQDGDTVLAVFNGLPVRRLAVVERLVVLQPYEGRSPEALALQDRDGAEIPFEIVEAVHAERFWGIDWRTDLWSERQQERLATYLREMGTRMRKTGEDEADADLFLRIRFEAPLPPVGHALFRLVPSAPSSAPVAAAGVTAEENVLENEHARVVLHPDGTLDLEDRATGRSWPGLNRLEDREDVGDEYDFSPAAEGETITADEARNGSVRVVEGGCLRGILEARFDLELPVQIDPDRTRRAPTRVSCPVRVRVGLDAGSPLVDVDIRFENRAEDHRLRVAMPSRLDAEEIWTHGHFHVTPRPVEAPTGEDWVQPHPGTWPQRDFALVEDAEGGLALLNRGLHEIEPRRGADGRPELVLTLLRCVGWLSRDDFPTRRHQNAGPTVPTPEAQCLGHHRFRYALLPYAGSWLDADVPSVDRAWRTPVPVVQGVRAGSTPGGDGLLEKTAKETVITAVKRHETRDTLVVRVTNLASVPVEERLGVPAGWRTAWRTDLLEERRHELTRTAQGDVGLPLRPHEIATVEIQLA